MKYRKLGQTGFDVSVVSFGTWQLGGGRWRGQSADAADRLLRSALDHGINLFDASTVYGQHADGNGYLQSRSQESLGRAFRDDRGAVYYCVKVGQFDEYSHRSDYSPGRMVAEFKQSLRRLQTDYVDVLLVHAPTLNKVEDERAISVAATLRELGHARAIGYSFEAEPLHVAAAVRQPIDVVMLQYNLLEPQCGDALRQLDRAGIGVLVGGPFKRGYLSGRYRTVADLPIDTEDYWRWNVAHNKRKVEATLDRVRRLLDEYGTPPELRRAALAHVLGHPGVSAAVVGFQEPEEVSELVRLVAELLPDADARDPEPCAVGEVIA